MSKLCAVVTVTDRLVRDDEDARPGNEREREQRWNGERDRDQPNRDGRAKRPPAEHVTGRAKEKRHMRE